MHLSGADMVDQTPVYDIKPYLPHIDSIPKAVGGFSTEIEDYTLTVSCDGALLAGMDDEKRECLMQALREDPHPSYIENDQRIYGFLFDRYEIKFKVEGRVLTVLEVIEL